VTHEWRGGARCRSDAGGLAAETASAGGLAAETASAGGLAAETASVPPGASEFLAIRTRFYDDQVRAATAAGLRQIVLLAAGLDCRAFRLGWPDGVRLFELDLPEVFAFKEPVLASLAARARCARRVVAVGLREPWSDR